MPDGGHISRNPAALVDLLLDLLPLRQCFMARDRVPPKQLSDAIDRAMPMVRFFRLGDGTMVRFNGGGADARPTRSPPCSLMTTPAARRSVQRRTRAMRAWSAAARLSSPMWRQRLPARSA